MRNKYAFSMVGLFVCGFVGFFLFCFVFLPSSHPKSYFSSSFEPRWEILRCYYRSPLLRGNGGNANEGDASSPLLSITSSHTTSPTAVSF